MPDSIQPREHSKGGGTGGISCNSDGDLNLLNANRDDDGRWLNAYNDRSDDRWRRDNGFAFVASQLSSFLSRFCGGVLFYELAVPPAEHLANGIKGLGKSTVLFGIQRFCFPQDLDEHF